jgi:hypothetical protein
MSAELAAHLYLERAHMLAYYHYDSMYLFGSMLDVLSDVHHTGRSQLAIAAARFVSWEYCPNSNLTCLLLLLLMLLLVDELLELRFKCRALPVRARSSLVDTLYH